MKQECSSVFEVTAKDTNNIFCTVKYGLKFKGRLVRNLPCFLVVKAVRDVLGGALCRFVYKHEIWHRRPLGPPYLPNPRWPLAAI